MEKRVFLRMRLRAESPHDNISIIHALGFAWFFSSSVDWTSPIKTTLNDSQTKPSIISEHTHKKSNPCALSLSQLSPEWDPMEHLGPTNGIMGLTQWLPQTNLRKRTTTLHSTKPRQWHPLASRSWKRVPPLVSNGSRPSTTKPLRNVD